LWAVRVCSTRTEATAVCKAGHTRVNGKVAKPATTIAAGDRVEARVKGRDRVLEVVEPRQVRVGAPLAVASYVDHSPPLPPREERMAVRDRGTGRPTKRERRDLDRFRGAGRRPD
jgi:ribosome-associated heat shock protein Hsp15